MSRADLAVDMRREVRELMNLERSLCGRWIGADRGVGD
jgi:hypothetical protein